MFTLCYFSQEPLKEYTPCRRNRTLESPPVQIITTTKVKVIQVVVLYPHEVPTQCGFQLGSFCSIGWIGPTVRRAFFKEGLAIGDFLL